MQHLGLRLPTAPRASKLLLFCGNAAAVKGEIMREERMGKSSAQGSMKISHSRSLWWVSPVCPAPLRRHIKGRRGNQSTAASLLEPACSAQAKLIKREGEKEPIWAWFCQGAKHQQTANANSGVFHLYSHLSAGRRTAIQIWNGIDLGTSEAARCCIHHCFLEAYTNQS